MKVFLRIVVILKIFPRRFQLSKAFSLTKRKSFKIFACVNRLWLPTCEIESSSLVNGIKLMSFVNDWNRFGFSNNLCIFETWLRMKLNLLFIFRHLSLRQELNLLRLGSCPQPRQGLSRPVVAARSHQELGKEKPSSVDKFRSGKPNPWGISCH